MRGTLTVELRQGPRWMLLRKLLRNLLRNFHFHTSTVVPIGACAHVLLGIPAFTGFATHFGGHGMAVLTKRSAHEGQAVKIACREVQHLTPSFPPRARTNAARQESSIARPSRRSIDRARRSRTSGNVCSRRTFPEMYAQPGRATPFTRHPDM